MTSEKAVFIHDTKRIIDVNMAGCELFRCDRSALIDLDFIDLIVNDDFKALARLRMSVWRESKPLKPMTYKVRRCDGSVFWIEATTRILENGLYETTEVYLGEA